MTNFQLYTSKRHNEGLYRVRIYSVPVGSPVSLAWHWNYLQENAKVQTVFDKILLDPIASHDVEAESEFAQGIPKISTLQLSLAAHPVFLPIIRAARDSKADVWIEIVLEQQVEGIPERPAGASIVWPLKKRSFYWGQLDRGTLHGAVGTQRFGSPVDNELVEADREHLGTVTMEFTHWLKVRGSDSVKTFLDTLYNKAWALVHLDPALAYWDQMSSFLFELCQAISPTKLLAVSDSTLKSNIVRAAIELPESLSSDGVTYRSNLSEQYMRVVKSNGGSPVSPLFANTADGPGPFSFYKWQDFAQALVEFSREWFLFPQVEIPAMEDAGPIENSLSYFEYTQNDANWSGVTRFLFLPLKKGKLKVYTDHEQGGIEYDAAGNFASSYKVEQPSTDGLPAPAFTIAKSELTGGSDQGYKTLFRFAGQSYVGGVLTDDIRGYEIFQQPSDGVFDPVRYVQNDEQTVGFQSWSSFHAWCRISVWGSVRSVLTIKCKHVGLEPFAAGSRAAGDKIAPIKQTWGFWDFGDFPLYRTMDARVGLMANPNDDIPPTYLTISVKQTPGEGKEIKLLEISPILNENPEQVIVAPTPPPDLPDTGPPTVTITNLLPTGSTVIGTQTVKVTATDDKTVSQVNLKTDGKLYSVLVTPTTGTEYQFHFDSTAYSNGSHTLTAEAFDTAGNSSSFSITVNVSN